MEDKKLETKVFKSGNSRAIRIPKEFDIPLNTLVYLHKEGNKIVLELDPWASLRQAIGKISSDFMTEREQPEQQERQWF